MQFRVLAKSFSALGLFVRCPFLPFFGLVLFVCLAPLWPVLFRRLFQVTSHHLFHLSFFVYFSRFRDRWQLPQGVRVTKKRRVNNSAAAASFARIASRALWSVVASVLAWSAWAWCAAGATGWPTPPSPCRSCARPTALSPWAGPGRCGGLLRREAVLPEFVAVRGARLVPEGFAGRDAGPGRLPCRWDHIVLGISARSHVDAATLRCALERMDAAWPEGKERMAKLSVNAMIGLWAEVVYSVRSSSSELHGVGADFSQAFAYEGGTVLPPHPRRGPRL